MMSRHSSRRLGYRDPRRMIQLSRHNAEIEADVDENGGDRAAAVLGGDLLKCGRAGDEPIPARVVQAGGALAEPFLEGGGAEQAAGDAVEDQRDD